MHFETGFVLLLVLSLSATQQFVSGLGQVCITSSSEYLYLLEMVDVHFSFWKSRRYKG